MSLDLAKKIISNYMEMDDGFDKIEIQFFGGEPMLAFPRIREIVDWFHSREWQKEHLFDICTNGTILNEEMKRWLRDNRNRVWVGFSLDGSRTSHNLTRSNSYDKLKDNMPFFLENWPGQFAKMTICAENIPYVAESIIELEELEIPFTSGLVFEDIWGVPIQKRRLLSIYAKQLSQLVEYYSKNPDLFPATIVGREIEYMSDSSTISQSHKEMPRFCGAGHEMIEVDVDGSISPCHRFAKWVTQRNPPALSSANQQKEWKPDKCANCKLISICPSCAGYNWEVNGDSGIRTTYHCEAFKLEVLASAKLQARRLKSKDISISDNISAEEYRMRNKIDSILYLVDKGI
jgi:radical SAM protein with 4Fe4S-binding SPASM domain